MYRRGSCSSSARKRMNYVSRTKIPHQFLEYRHGKGKTILPHLIQVNGPFSQCCKPQPLCTQSMNQTGAQISTQYARTRPPRISPARPDSYSPTPSTISRRGHILRRARSPTHWSSSWSRATAYWVVIVSEVTRAMSAPSARPMDAMPVRRLPGDHTTPRMRVTEFWRQLRICH